MNPIVRWAAVGFLATAFAPCQAAGSAESADDPAGIEIVATQDKRAAVAAWEEIRRMETRRLESVDPELARRALADPDTYRYDPFSREPVLTVGEFAGRWRFFGKDGAARPYAAWRQLPATAGGMPRFELFCGGRACDELRAQLAAMYVPRGAPPSQLDEWKALAAAETCESGPVSTPPPRYPPDLLRSASAGTVGLVLLVNGCGQVRRAWVGASSGYRGLDEAAVAAAMSWRVAPPEDGKGGALLRTRVSFSY